MTMEHTYEEISHTIERKMRQAIQNNANLRRQKENAARSEDDLLLAWALSHDRPASRYIETAVLKDIAQTHNLKPNSYDMEPRVRQIIYGMIARRTQETINRDRQSVDAFINSLGQTPPPL